MFQWISIIGFATVITAILLHALLFPCGYSPRFSLGALIRKKVHLFTLLLTEQKLNWPTKFRKLVFLLGLLSFLVLLATGFGPLLFGARLHGVLLMIHATFAPVFIGCAAVVAILGAGQYCFNKKDTQSLQCGCNDDSNTSCWLTDSGVGAKVGFWVLLLMSLPVTLTMVLSMLPLFGPEGQEFLFYAHRWSALVFALTAIVELYMLVRIGVLKDIKTLH